MNKKRVIIWFNEPPKAEKGAYNYLADNWGSEVIYVINEDLPDYRKTTGWDVGTFANATVIGLWNFKNKDHKVEELCAEYKDDIHILAGFIFELPMKAFQILSRQESIIGVYTERPTFMGGKLELIVRRVYSFFKYRKIYYEFNKHVSFLLPLGMSALKDYHTYGWSLDKMFNFMYNPNIPERLSSRELKKGEPVRFVYVGRFYNKTKGVDTLLEACKRVYGNWSLHLVGGYGPDAGTTIQKTNTIENVMFIGSWKAGDVVKNLSEYDVVVVPSKYDGWNLLANESIHAGIGCIISDEAVSDEVISNSKSGKVFKAKDAQQLAVIMQSCIDNHAIVNQWKKNASEFVDCISEDTVGRYLISILEYVTGYSTNRPSCPWIRN